MRDEAVESGRWSPKPGLCTSERDVALSAPHRRPQPLAGLRVVDLSVSLGASFCTSLLQRLGARVTTVDTGPWPDGSKSLFADEHLAGSPVYAGYVGRGKDSVTADVSGKPGRALVRRLLADADVLVEDWRPEVLSGAGLDVGSLRAEFPALIVASVSPFGREGERGGWLASDLTLFHGGGPGFATPGLVADPETMPPIRLGSHQGSFISGLTAAVNVCAAVLLARRNPGQEGVRVDFSCHEAMANAFRQSLGTFAFYGGGLNRDLARGRGAGGTADYRTIRCKDGWISLSWAGVKQWETLKEFMGYPEWMEDERLSNPGLRQRNWSVAMQHLEEWAAEHDRETLFFLCQGSRIPCAPVNDGGDLLDSEALESRGFWDESSGAGRPDRLPDIGNQFAGVDQ
jgi:crotonobetainyl-CoA:carnitine CoA-transferase CaiB-like acyl-CoA transferase